MTAPLDSHYFALWPRLCENSIIDSGDPAAINPFTRDQEIVIEELNGFFMGIGTNRSEANCYLNNVSGVDGEGNPTFYYGDLVFRTCVDADETGVCDSEESQH